MSLVQLNYRSVQLNLFCSGVNTKALEHKPNLGVKLNYIRNIIIGGELYRLPSLNYEPILIGGDFNIIRYVKDKNTMNGVHKHKIISIL